MRFLFVVHKNEEKAEQNSVLFHRLTLKERGLRPNGYFPLMRQPPSQGAFVDIPEISLRDISCIITKERGANASPRFSVCFDSFC